VKGKGRRKKGIGEGRVEEVRGGRDLAHPKIMVWRGWRPSGRL